MNKIKFLLTLLSALAAVACSAPVPEVRTPAPVVTSPPQIPLDEDQREPELVVPEPVPTPAFLVLYHGNGNSAGAEPRDPKTYAPGEEAILLPGSDLRRTGEVFAGWSSRPDGTGGHYQAGDRVNLGNKNLRFYARWEYKVTYEPGIKSSGRVPEDPKSYGPGETVVVRNQGNLTRRGNTFVGWNTRPDGQGAQYASGDLLPLGSRSLTLYAQWKAETRRILFASNDPSQTQAQQILEADSQVALMRNPFLRAGYLFSGWNTLQDGTGLSYWDEDPITMDLEDINLFAQWVPDERMLTYLPNEGEGSEIRQALEVDSEIFLRENPFFRDGFLFRGWNTLADGSGTPYSDQSQFLMGTENLNLFAQRTPDERKITFMANDGTDVSLVQSVRVNTSAALTPLAFAREGYGFGGWTTDPDGTGQVLPNGSIFALKTSDVTLYAKWVPNKNTITFYGNTGKGSMPLQILDSGTSGSLNIHTFNKSGYLFNGWNTSADGTGKSYADGERITMGTERMVIYAQWDFPDQMLSIPAGTLLTDKGQAVISAFSMSNVKVTQSQYQKIMGTNPSYFSKLAEAPNCPVDSVSWYDTLVYCNRLSVREGLTPVYSIAGSPDTEKWGAIPKGPDPKWDAVVMNNSASGYRLPTEAQWEYANRAGTATDFYWGNGSDFPTVDKYAWYDENSRNIPHGVGEKLPNPWGIYDITGNMYEWCWDLYDDGSEQESEGSPSVQASQYRVQRGGSWSGSIHVMHADFRNYSNPHYPSLTTGFRVVKP